MSNSVRPHRWKPTRLLCPWDSPGKNTGVGCHFLLQRMNVKSEREAAQSCPTLRDPMDCSPPGSPVHGIFQARVLEWGAVAFSVCMLYPDEKKNFWKKEIRKKIFKWTKTNLYITNLRMFIIIMIRIILNKSLVFEKKKKKWGWRYFEFLDLREHITSHGPSLVHMPS